MRPVVVQGANPAWKGKLRHFPAVEGIEALRPGFDKEKWLWGGVFLVWGKSGHVHGAGGAGTGATHHMGVNHGGLEGGMAEQVLDGADVDAAFKEVRGQ